MNEVLSYALSLIVGFVLGYIFFGGLWWTVRRLPKMKHPMLWTFISLILRMTVAVTGFLLIARGGHWVHLLVCLGGFITVRFILTRPKKKQLSKPEKKEVG